MIDMITQEELKDLFHYDPDTGYFTRLSTGKRVGYARANKRYRGFKVGGVEYTEHRLAWLYMTGSFPKLDIDHDNRDGLDNRWNNLLEKSRQDNLRNKGKGSNNTSGVVGVRFDKGGFWEAYIKVDKKNKKLYHGGDFFEAICRRFSAEEELGFHPNHGR